MLEIMESESISQEELEAMEQLDIDIIMEDINNNIINIIDYD